MKWYPKRDKVERVKWHPTCGKGARMSMDATREKVTRVKWLPRRDRNPLVKFNPSLDMVGQVRWDPSLDMVLNPRGDQGRARDMQTRTCHKHVISFKSAHAFPKHEAIQRISHGYLYSFVPAVFHIKLSCVL